MGLTKDAVLLLFCLCWPSLKALSFEWRKECRFGSEGARRTYLELAAATQSVPKHQSFLSLEDSDTLRVKP